MGTRNAVVMTLGTGIGAGIIADGAVYRGGSFAGEAGHMTMIPDGDPCECGRRGCWETLVSGRRFGEDARRIIESDPSGILATIVEDAEPNGSFLGVAAAAGDVAARDAVDRGRSLAWAGGGQSGRDPRPGGDRCGRGSRGGRRLASRRRPGGSGPVRRRGLASATGPNRSGPMRSPGRCHRGGPAWPLARRRWMRLGSVAASGPKGFPQMPDRTYPHARKGDRCGEGQEGGSTRRGDSARGRGRDPGSATGG